MKYVIFLRGINISGKNKIDMKILKKYLNDCDLFSNVTTYLNSGNVILDSDIKDKDEIGNIVRKIIKNDFSLDIPCYVTTRDELLELLSNTPSWLNSLDKSIYNNIIFIMPPYDYLRMSKELGVINDKYEKIYNYKDAVFWSFDLKNYRKTYWWSKTSLGEVKDSITIRTYNTVKKVLQLCDK